MLLALLHPEVYDKIAQGTRHTYASNKPRAVLFEGPPGQLKIKAVLAHLTGYVEQDDIHIPAFTVHEFPQMQCTHLAKQRCHLTPRESLCKCCQLTQSGMSLLSGV